MDWLLELGAQHGAVLVVLAVVGLLASGFFAVLAGLARRKVARTRTDLALLRRRYAAVLASTSDGMVLQTAAGQIIDINTAARDMFGLDGQDYSGVLVGDLPVVLVNAQGQALNPAAVLRHTPSGLSRATAPIDAELVGIARAGQPLAAARMVQVISRMVAGGGIGSPVILTTIEDMTVQGEVKAALERSELQFRVAMENAPIGMALVDLSWHIIEVNSAFAELLGTTREALVGYGFADVSHPEDREQERMLVQSLLAGHQSRFSLEKRYLRADGHIVWTMLDVALVRTPNSASDHFVAQVRDTTESRLKSEMLAHRAMHDPLTGLANRTLLQEVLQSVLDQPRRDRVAVLACDLDGFKAINDRYGHAAGDEVLVHVAGVLRAAIGARGTVARMGGDEFVIVLQDMESERVAFEVATTIHTNLKEPLRLHRRRMVVRASIGIALADADTMAGGAPGLLAAADAALYRAKAAGRSCTEVYDTTMEVAGGRHGLQAELQGALDRGEIALHYQPFVDLASGQVLGHEALVRWEHPSRGLLLPGMFLSLAEEMGLGVRLGMHVVSEAVGYLARCQDQSRWVSVNVSAD
ncbi:MAG: diguanylate cyclase, partial [Actinomycetales bacterium]|nr:diguanylate cyclase [Actinomycetales bacterium]